MLIYEVPAGSSIQEVSFKCQSKNVPRPKSSRLRHKIDNTYAYFSKKVDHLIAACVANFLFRQPVDVFNSMKFYFLHMRKGLGENCFIKIECRDPKLPQKVYFAQHLGPVLAKVVDSITVTQPSDVVNFVCEEFINNKAWSVSCGNTDQKVEIFKQNLSSRRGSQLECEVPNTRNAENVSPAESSPVGKDIATRKNLPKKRGSILAIKNIRVCVIGNSGSGKTSILNALEGNFEKKPKPSLGFKPIAMKLGDDININFYDLGGGKKIRSIWCEYFHDVHAVLYAFDASLKGEELEDSIALFQSTMMNPLLAGKPLFILANKQDCEGALNAQELSAFLDLRACNNAGYVIAECVSFTSTSSSSSSVVSSGGIPTNIPNKIENALVDDTPVTFGVDVRFETALESFLEIVKDHYTALDSRVSSDVATKTNIEMKKRIEKDRKVLKNKIASAFRNIIQSSYLPENLPDPSPDDAFTKTEGKISFSLKLN